MIRVQKYLLLGIIMLMFVLNVMACIANADTPTKITPPIFSTSQMQTLADGRVLISVEKVIDKTGKSARVSSSVEINASPETIWAVLIDCQRSPTYVPGLKKCEILQEAKDKSWDIRRHTNKPAVFLPKMISEFRCDYDFAKSIRFISVGGDMDTNTGSWTLRVNKDGSKTIVTYNARIAAKTVVPDKMIRKVMKKNVPKVMQALRQEVMRDKAKLSDKSK